MSAAPDRAGLLREAALDVVARWEQWQVGDFEVGPQEDDFTILRAALAATGDSEGPGLAATALPPLEALRSIAQHSSDAGSRFVARAALAATGDSEGPLDVEARRLLGYLWTAEGNDDHRRPCDLFADDDPIVAAVERLAIFEDAGDIQHYTVVTDAEGYDVNDPRQE